jgi:hypothetical protein
VTLLLILVLVTLVLFAIFLGGGIVAQGYLYQAPADHLPLRALAGAVLVGSFLTLWVWVDSRNPRRYDTLFEFAPYETAKFDEMEAVRWPAGPGGKVRTDASGNPVEQVVKFKRGVGAKANTFLDEKTGEPFHLNTGAYMTAAVLVKPTPDAEPVRFDALLGKDRRSYLDTPDGRRFVEVGGSRYVQADQMGVLYIPSTGTVVLALLINLLHFVAWFAAFWVILQFTRGHAFILAVSFGLVTMLLVLPLLFKPNRTPKTPEPAPAAALIRTAEPPVAA